MTETLREEKSAADTNALRTAASTRARRAESVEVSRKYRSPAPLVSTSPEKGAMTPISTSRGKGEEEYTINGSLNVIMPLLPTCKEVPLWH